MYVVDAILLKVRGRDTPKDTPARSVRAAARLAVAQAGGRWPAQSSGGSTSRARPIPRDTLSPTPILLLSRLYQYPWS